MLSKLNCLLAFLLLAATGQPQTLKIANARPHPLKQEVPPAFRLSRTADTAATERCGFALMMQGAVSRGFDNAAFEAEVARLVQRKLAQGRTGLEGTVTVPVIFHVVYRTADAPGTNSANLIASKFQAQVDQLNIDYANAAGSRWPVATNVPIRFCLAVVDTAGRLLAEPGIERINGQARGWANTNTLDLISLMNYFDTLIKPASIWDPYSYVNVWTAAMTGSNLLGYASFPTLSALPGLETSTETDATAGVVIAWESVGSTANPGASAQYGGGRTLTHELGHFFGLRHIWGDAACGTDYCNDTPTQSAETRGCPTADTLTNCTPLVRKMFENYMDYSNDACLNTFTADQSLRCRTVMDNSPRRASLIQSKACVARPGNAISFAAALPQTVAETGNGGCPNTRSYTFRIYVSVAATGAATVTFGASGSAVMGRDFTVTPASVTYTAGDGGVKTVTINVIDDEAAEGDETLTLGYTISGSGVAAGPDKQVLNLTIVDDDTDSFPIDEVQPVKSILRQNFDTSAGTIPTGWRTESAVLLPFLPSNQWTVSANGGSGTSGRSAHITSDTVLKPNSYSILFPTDAYLFTPLLDAGAFHNLNLAFKWRCRGDATSALGYIGYVPEGLAPTAANVIYFDISFSGQAAGAAAATANLNLPSSLSGKKFYFVFNWFNDFFAGISPGFTVDSIVLTGSVYRIATTTDADTAFAQYTGQTVTYFSKSTTPPVINRIIAKVSGLSDDAGCVTASIPSAGTGRTLVGGNGFYRTDKVIQLTPATSLPSASYTVTLYYTVAEMAAWGPQIPILKILKLKDGVPLNGPYLPGDFQLAITTFADYSATGYYSYTAAFTNGFSRFMLALPEAGPLPVTLLRFTATPQGKVILLQWSTSQEVNNKGFALERSTDGANFTRVGWIAGKGNSSTQTDYDYTDRLVQPNVLYYYRLRQTDADNLEKLSGIEQARIQEAGITVTVSPVPAKDYLRVFASGMQRPAFVSLVNAQGQVVKQWQNVNLFTQAYKLNVSGVPAGVYVLKIDVASQQTVKKITIER